MPKGYIKELDSIRIANVNSGSFSDILITLSQLQNGKLQWDAWRTKRNSPDGEGIKESAEFTRQKTTFFEVPGLSFNGFPNPIFVCGLGKRSNLENKIFVVNK